MANRHFRKIEARRRAAQANADPENREIAPVGGTYIVTKPGGTPERIELKEGETLEVPLDSKVERVVDKPPSFAPYSISRFESSRPRADRETRQTGPEAIAQAGVWLADSDTECVEVYDCHKNLVAIGNAAGGLRILRRLDCDPEETPADKVPELPPHFVIDGPLVEGTQESIELVVGDKCHKITAAELALEAERCVNLVSAAVLARDKLEKVIEIFRAADVVEAGSEEGRLRGAVVDARDSLTAVIDAIEVVTE